MVRNAGIPRPIIAEWAPGIDLVFSNNMMSLRMAILLHEDEALEVGNEEKHNLSGYAEPLIWDVNRERGYVFENAQKIWKHRVVLRE
jgi:hypothetical protein